MSFEAVGALRADEAAGDDVGWSEKLAVLGVYAGNHDKHAVFGELLALAHNS
jgi:hypothetical protein